MKDISNIREDYKRGSLEESEIPASPFTLFEEWFLDAESADIKDFNAMTLATADNDGQPNARIVLLKNVSEGGFTFFTNYSSKKGEELLENDKACLVFFWSKLERQIRIRGTVKKVSQQESEEYYQKRPVGSRLGAWASEQSKAIPNREYLEKRVEEYTEKYGETPPLPEFWGGYRLIPHEIEFWQGRSSRLHDRILYTSDNNKAWKTSRLSP